MKAGNDQQYETAITNRNGSHDNIVMGNDQIIRHGGDLGGGISFKASPRFNIGIEEKVTFVFDNGDFGGVITTPTQRPDFFSNTQLRLNFNLGSAAKRVEPLWWLNPNNYLYTSAAKRMLLPDADGDGVTDQFDLEPNTPPGAPVDTHGRALDTDGDGVPDYRDKEVLTPQKWFPVDANGVGTEPEPACCKELRDKIAHLQLAPPPPTCAVTSFPSVKIKGGKAKLGQDAQTILASVASQLNANPACKVKVIAYGASNKRAQQLSWERAQAVSRYLIEKQGIAENRIIFIYGQDGDPNTVDLQPTTEDGQGPSVVPAPHPNLR
jgi:outer membrane protein OmpA-like peptidoglycan-associated protein